MDRKCFIGIMLIALVLVAPVITHAAPAQKQIKLVWGSHWQPKMAPYQVLERWFKKLEQLSNGQLKFKIYPGGTISSMRTALYDLDAGTTDFQNVSAHVFTAEFPITHTMQYFFYDYKEDALARKVWWQTFNHFPEIRAEYKITRPFITIGPGEMQIHSRKAVRTLGDMKGLQIGVGGAYLIPILEKFGAVPSDLSFLEFYSGLQKNLIDACTFNNEVLQIMKLAEVTKYTMWLGGSYDPCGGIFSMREETWKSLPPNIQKLFNDTREEAEMDFVKTVYESSERGKKFASSKGHEFIEWSQEDLAKWRSVCEQIARAEAAKLDKKGCPGTKIFEYTRKAKKELD